MVDWSKYIPASGEVNAQLGLKGRYGGSRMRKSYRRRSRFSYSKPKNRWWWSETYNEQTWVSWPQIGETVPNLVAMSIAPQGLGVEAGSPDYLQRSVRPVRLLMTQGVIMFRMYPTSRSNSAQLSEINANLTNQWPLLLHWNWTLKRAAYDDAVLAVAGAYNSSPPVNPDSDLRNMLLSKRVISFGMTPVKYQWPTVQLPYFNTNTESVATIPMSVDPNGQNFTYLPRPRIPKRGILFRPGDELQLNVAITTSNFSAINMDENDLGLQYYTGNFRCLMSEG